MRVKVSFYSYFKELAGCSEIAQELPEDSKLEELLQALWKRFPQLKPMQRSTLVAVGIEYQEPGYVLKEGDEVSLFPPVQGG
ncbi:MAG TPA: MoaD/ThiS family protein [Verrucomicrobiae bacterium]|nr:MoaD/ThiS family protein [Verrucomicrobiae bacterium]